MSNQLTDMIQYRLPREICIDGDVIWGSNEFDSRFGSFPSSYSINGIMLFPHDNVGYPSVVKIHLDGSIDNCWIFRDTTLNVRIANA